MVAFDDEQWRSVPSEPNYAVSSHGRVMRVIGGQGAKQGQPLKLSKCGPYHGISTSHDGTLRHRYVHALVAEAFIGPRPDGMVVRHIDGDGRNNRVSNLAYGTQRENILDKARHGTLRFGDAHHNTKLRDEQMLQAVVDALEIGQHPAARKHGISQANLWKVMNGHARAHLFDRVQALKAQAVEMA